MPYLALKTLYDASVVRWAQTRRLFTREDGRFLHLHKILGVVVLAHFAYRLALWLRYGSMGLDDGDVERDRWTLLALYAAHALLHVSSFEFHLPARRNTRYNVIWPEMRWHTMIFAYRSLAVLMMHWAGVALLPPLLRSSGGAAQAAAAWWASVHPGAAAAIAATVRGGVVLATMVAADSVTESYRRRMRQEQMLRGGGSDTTEEVPLTMKAETSMTMRANPYPAYLPAACTRAHNLFYSTSQVLATLNIVTAASMDRVFLLLLPIQTAPFCMTLVKKGVITQAGWHLYYTLALLANYALALTPLLHGSSSSSSSSSSTMGEEGVCGDCSWCTPIPRAVYLTLALAFVTGRFVLRRNKYALWTAVIAVCAATAAWQQHRI